VSETLSDRPDWFDIERKSPVIEFEIKGRVFECHYGNTFIYTFPGIYTDFNHVFIMDEDMDRGTYIFNCPDLMDGLHDYDFPTTHQPWPSEQDVEAFIKTEMQDFNNL
jgi:hypothetical protein